MVVAVIGGGRCHPGALCSRRVILCSYGVLKGCGLSLQAVGNIKIDSKKTWKKFFKSFPRTQTMFSSSFGLPIICFGVLWVGVSR